MAYRNKLFPQQYPQRSPNEDELRGSGRTQALVLSYLGLAISNPGQWIKVKDHYDTRASHAALLARMRVTVEALGLQHMVFDGVSLQVKSGVLEWVA